MPELPDWLIAVIAGVVEGVTEFLPISSTGHLIITSDLLQFDSLEGTFEIFIQIGAVIAVLLFYRAELLLQAQSVLNRNPEKNEDKIRTQNSRQLWLGIIIAFIPAAVIGLLFGDQIDEWLFNPTTVAIALIVGGVMFIAVESFIKGKETEQQSIENVPLTYVQALLVGCWQVLALIPGMSRSGMSIIGGMLSGLDRQRATQFSFYLAMPTLGAATLYTLIKDLDSISGNDFFLLILGAIVSGIVAWFSIGWLLRYVASNSFIPFGYYRIIVGILILILVYAPTFM